MRRFTLVVCLLCALCVGGMAAPNLVVILVDDMGWRDTGFSGSTVFTTPHLDRMAKAGVIFTEAHASAPNCAPTRACLMTGQYTPRHGVYTVVDDRHQPGGPGHRILAAESKPELDTKAFTLAEALREEGYATGMVGMWNLGRGRRGLVTPMGQGFDSFVQPKDLGFDQDAYVNASRDYLTDKLTDAAIEFVEDHRDRPMFLYLAYHAIHSPFDPKPELLAAYGDEKDQAAYAATIEVLDQNVGRLAESLPANTVLFFTSDNGGTQRYVAPLRGGKGTLYQGGVRVPAFVTGAGIPANRQVPIPISTVDIYPTLLELACVTPPQGVPLDGVSLVPLWQDQAFARESLFWHFPCYAGRGTPSSAIRNGEYKLIEFFESGDIELYNLSEDPGEAHDLSADKPQIATRLYHELKQWQSELGAPCPIQPNPDCDPAGLAKKGREDRGKGRKK